MIAIKNGPYKSKNSSSNERWFVVLDNGIGTTRARWIMMNFLHTNYIPRRLHVHHINGVPSDDRIENLELLLNSDHTKKHNPKNYRYGVSCSDDPIINLIYDGRKDNV